tara:strand:+ start:600 stop:830 length:231 start_codon:yes stop_codon:yes gene_type:complete
MPSMADMVQAHLTNVQREIQNLKDRKVAIDAEITKLEEYLKEGATTLEAENDPPQPVATPQEPAANPLLNQVSLGG